jgi:transmembrane sensor
MTEDLSPQQGAGHIDWKAVGRYLAGESSQAETAVVREWLTTHAADAELLHKLDGAIARVVAQPVSAVDVEAALRRVRERRMRQPNEGQPQPASILRVDRGAAAAPRRRRWSALGVGALAAAAVLTIAAIALWRSRGVEEQASFAGRSVITGVGQRDSLHLPDGTVIQIGPDSRLTVEAGYAAGRREIRLEGKAYFAVPHDASRPFIVRSGQAVIQDLGTEFAVEQLPADRVRVVVLSGVVALRAADAPDSSVELREGDVGELQPPRRLVVERRTATPDDVAWKQGRLVFRNASLATVRAELKRWYGIELRTEDPGLDSRRLSAEFAGEPADQVLRAIALSLGAALERRGDTAIVRSVRGGPRPR